MDEIQDYKYKFSIVMAVYNVEPFIEEAIDSVINQTIGFRENVQLILVDDGSPDNSGAICDVYKEKYPDNIIVIHKENGGVSSARNEGLKCVQGKYVNFLDSDDKLSENALEEVYNFFEQHYDEIDVVSIPLYFFDAQEGEHILNYKFKKGNRVINLRKEYDAVQMSISSAFLKQEKIQNINFDSNLKIAEDAKVIIKILLEKMLLGVVATGKYYYRRRSVGASSAIQSSHSNYYWYLPFLNHFTQDIYDYSIQKFLYVPAFIQYTLMYDLQWKLKQEKIPLGVLTENEQEEYYNLLFELIARFDDKIILEQKNLAIEYKVFLLKKKYNRMPQAVYYDNNLALHYENTYLTDFASHKTVIEFIKFENESLTIEGHIVYIPVFAQHNQKVFISVNGCYHECEMISRNNEKSVNGELIVSSVGFKLVLPISELQEENVFAVYLSLNGMMIRKTNLSWGIFSPVTSNYKNQYYINDNWKVTAQKDCIRISQLQSSLERMKLETEFILELLKSKKNSDKKAGLARITYRLMKPFKRKNMWLVSDRVNKADDNGEAFFLYLQKKKEIDSYFVINEESNDYERLGKEGKVLVNLSYKHKLKYLLSDVLISSHADGNTFNPFAGYSDPYRDIIVDKKIVFLQHGIIKDDLSSWLNRYNKNLDIFVTSAPKEYQSILDTEAYFYTNRNVKLTGLPRYDYLKDNRKKIITVMPTWRKYLMSSLNSKTGVWGLSSNIQSTEYFEFYNSLINNQKLLDTLTKHDYELHFMPHPNIMPFLDKFTQNKDVVFNDLEKPYREIFNESALIITDYSSVAFDFAFLRKPVLYSQFDSKQFFAGEHAYTKGYFDYARDGFGEVCTNLETTVDTIIEYVQNGCQLKDKYRARIDNFFAFNDKNNCQRVYDEIMKLGK